MKHTFSCLVRNHPGVLERVTAAFADFKVNIRSMAVSETEQFDTSRITIVVHGHDEEVQKISGMLRTLPEIVQLDDLASKDFVHRELALVKVRSHAGSVSQISQVAELFGARACAVGHTTITLEAVGDEDKIDGLIQMLGPVGIVAVARTGRIALLKGDEA